MPQVNAFIDGILVSWVTNYKFLGANIGGAALIQRSAAGYGNGFAIYTPLVLSGSPNPGSTHLVV